MQFVAEQASQLQPRPSAIATYWFDRKESMYYRPISLLPVVASVFEKLIHDQLDDYLDENSHQFSNQSCFRALHSVVSCLLDSNDDWYINMDNGRYTANIFIDLKKGIRYCRS